METESIRDLVDNSMVLWPFIFRLQRARKAVNKPARGIGRPSHQFGPLIQNFGVWYGWRRAGIRKIADQLLRQACMTGQVRLVKTQQVVQVNRSTLRVS